MRHPVDSCGGPRLFARFRSVTTKPNKYNGENLGGTDPFVYSATGGAHTVTASYTYALVIPLAGTSSLPLSATVCFP